MKRKTANPIAANCKRKMKNLIKHSKECDEKIDQIYKKIVSDTEDSLKQTKQQLREWKRELNRAQKERDTDMVEFYKWCIEELEDWVERDKERIKTFSPKAEKGKQ